ncbi:uncharacterized protein PHACADRAFT_150064 [Phanerochaete carnosa HHB-10118-sp]|uniref:Arrestin-like N-terminal domain-containing protein n=1 Tax=Phanerochaete carnosa (strain HHB-10118-sp) TaxID=650164 RepID=K5WMN4_PHACS|nr:uncharacterized protein PHACADRAFT_150064 [Phanerochaete carnosa HHB-10118-sp]EKM51572.1 hypothetical protein PHACADRAFT_150064 [Phanerochaete carnosa HHB-10118-sp]
MGKDALDAVNLVFNSRLHVAGEFVEGAVDLYFPKLVEDDIEEVHIKLRGAIMTLVHNHFWTSDTNYYQHVDICRANISLWKKGSTVYPQPNTHVLRLPFRFTLPVNLPPSCFYSGLHWSGTVGYFLEAVGERHGLHFNHRVQQSFPVLPVDNRGVRLRSALSAGWNGGWKTYEARDKIRRGIWGDYSQVHATLIFPDTNALPILTPIPVTLSIVTVTKTMKFDDHKEKDEIFPEPPQDSKKYELNMVYVNYVKARGYTEGGGEHMQAARKVWIPSNDSHDEKKHKGQWRQEVAFRSSFILDCPPSFSTEILSLEAILIDITSEIQITDVHYSIAYG